MKPTMICEYNKHLLIEIKREKIIHCKTHHLIVCYKISLKALKQPSQKFWPKFEHSIFFRVTST